MNIPLAQKIKPKNLNEIFGQKHILGNDGLLAKIINSGEIPNLIFYGPPGTGKTTVAQIISEKTNKKLYKLNATTASLSDIKEIVMSINPIVTPNGVLLYLDEIQYFNKKQQQSLLEFLENGKITLIASTTENPYFYVYNAILSRCHVFEFKPVETEEIIPRVPFSILIGYEYYDKFKRALSSYDIKNLSEDFAGGITIKGEIAESGKEKFAEDFTSITMGRAQLTWN